MPTAAAKDQLEARSPPVDEELKAKLVEFHVADLLGPLQRESVTLKVHCGRVSTLLIVIVTLRKQMFL